MKYVLFWSIAILWLASALPVIGISLFSLEMPLWPNFGPESTTEGRIVWAVFTSWIYITPLLLLAFRRFGRRVQKT